MTPARTLAAALPDVALRRFRRDERGFTGAEKALIGCFALLAILIVSYALRQGANQAAQDAQRALVNHDISSPSGSWGPSKAISATGGIEQTAYSPKPKSGGSGCASTVAHVALGGLSLIPVVGTPFALADGALYLAQGQYVNAAISFAGAIPVVGDGAELAGDAIKGGELIADGARGADDAVRGADAVSNLGKDTDGMAALASKGDEAASKLTPAQLRQQEMLNNGVGYNVSPTKWDSYGTIGRNGSYVTDKEALSGVLKDVPAGATETTISSSKASALEHDLGLEPGSLQDGFKIRRVEGLADRAPRSPLEGNRFFQGPGQHLPGGGPEAVIDSIPTTDAPGVSTIVKINVK